MSSFVVRSCFSVYWGQYTLPTIVTLCMHLLNWISTDKHVRFASSQQKSADRLFTTANQTITTTKLNLRANQRGIAFSPQLCGLFFPSPSPSTDCLAMPWSPKMQNQLTVTMKVYKTYSNISPTPIKSALPARERQKGSDPRERGWDLRLFYDKHKYTNCMRTTLLRLQTALGLFTWGLNQTRPGQLGLEAEQKRPKRGKLGPILHSSRNKF